MEIGKFYFVKNSYFEKYDTKKQLMSNKESVDGNVSFRPCFFAFSDINNSNIIWCVPISSKVSKYEKIVNYKIDKLLKKGIKNPICNTIKFGKVLGEKRAFLIQNMFPVTQEYIESMYIDKHTKEPVYIQAETQQEIITNAKNVIKLFYKGQNVTLTNNLIEIYNNISKDLKQDINNDEVPVKDNIVLNNTNRIVLDITGKNQKSFVKEIETELKQGIKDVYTSERWIEWLKFNRNLYHYSARNRLLIFLQMPYATTIASMTDWNKKFNRTVIKGQGSQGLKILKPTEFYVDVKQSKLDEDGNKIIDSNGNIVTETVKVKRTGYIPVSVYDVSQTQGDPLPTLVDELKGFNADKDNILLAIEKITGIKPEFKDIAGGAKGYFTEEDGIKKIIINLGMSDEQTIKTAVHEMAHSILHNSSMKRSPEGNKSRETRELEAESIAYLVCQQLGIDTSDYSFGYLAGWTVGKTDELLAESLDTIINTSQELSNDLNYHLKRYNLSKCQCPEACEVFLKTSESLQKYDKDTYNKRVSEVDKISSQSKIFIEINISENPFFKEGEIWSLQDIDKIFHEVDLKTKEDLTNKGYPNCYEKVRFTVYFENKLPDGNITYSRIIERYDFADLTHNNLTEYLRSFPCYTKDLDPIINNMEQSRKQTKTR
ncbi:MAG: LPD25 domain-containing protein [Oscillospiraceae bacterium]